MDEDLIHQQDLEDNIASTAGNEQFPNAGDPNGNFQMPSVDEIWKMVQQMDDITDEEREDIRQNLFNPKSPEELLKQYAQPRPSSRDYMIFFIMLAIIVLVFALFGYKLYKSLKAKELKKQEKLKGKHSKKAKKSN